MTPVLFKSLYLSENSSISLHPLLLLSNDPLQYPARCSGDSQHPPKILLQLKQVQLHKIDFSETVTSPFPVTKPPC